MVLYNITLSVDASLADEWINYMHKEHIPAVLDTGHFRDFKLCRVEGDEQGGLTFAVQYVAHSVDAFNTYQKECAPALQKELLIDGVLRLLPLELFFQLFQKEKLNGR